MWFKWNGSGFILINHPREITEIQTKPCKRIFTKALLIHRSIWISNRRVSQIMHASVQPKEAMPHANLPEMHFSGMRKLSKVRSWWTGLCIALLLFPAHIIQPWPLRAGMHHPALWVWVQPCDSFDPWQIQRGDSKHSGACPMRNLVCSHLPLWDPAILPETCTWVACCHRRARNTGTSRSSRKPPHGLSLTSHPTGQPQHEKEPVTAVLSHWA